MQKMDSSSIYEDLNNSDSIKIATISQKLDPDPDEPNSTTSNNNRRLNNPNFDSKPIKPQSDALNLYDDLHNADLGEKVIRLQKHNDKLTGHIAQLNNDIAKLCGELIKMKSTEEKLKLNISELFNTAKVEIARKDRMIAELRQKNDDLLFKRRSKMPIHSAPGTSIKQPDECLSGYTIKPDESLGQAETSSGRGSSRSYSKSPKREERSRSHSKYDSGRSRSRRREHDHKRQFENHSVDERNQSPLPKRRKDNPDPRVSRDFNHSISNKESSSVMYKDVNAKHNNGCAGYESKNFKRGYKEVSRSNYNKFMSRNADAIERRIKTDNRFKLKSEDDRKHPIKAENKSDRSIKDGKCEKYNIIDQKGCTKQPKVVPMESALTCSTKESRIETVKTDLMKGSNISTAIHGNIASNRPYINARSRRRCVMTIVG